MADLKYLKDKKIFLIENSTIIQGILTNALEKFGAILKYGQSTDSSLVEIIKWKPDLIITSVLLGKISGFDLCMILKLIPDYESIPIIILSTSAKDEIKRKLSDVGADFYIQKNTHLVKNLKIKIKEIFYDDASTPNKKLTFKKDGKILLVDDSYVMRRIISNILKSINFNNICEATDGVDALSKLDKENISLILTDWNMPRMNGLDFIKNVKKNNKFKNIPIFMVTTESAAEDVKKAKKIGVDDFVFKPFTKEKIKDIIRNHFLN